MDGSDLVVGFFFFNTGCHAAAPVALYVSVAGSEI